MVVACLSFVACVSFAVCCVGVLMCCLVVCCSLCYGLLIDWCHVMVFGVGHCALCVVIVCCGSWLCGIVRCL